MESLCFRGGEGRAAFDLYKIYENGIEDNYGCTYQVTKNPVLSKIFWRLAEKYAADPSAYDQGVSSEQNHLSLSEEEKFLVDIIWKEFEETRDAVSAVGGRVNKEIIELEIQWFDRLIEHSKLCLEGLDLSKVSWSGLIQESQLELSPLVGDDMALGGEGVGLLIDFST